MNKSRLLQVVIFALVAGIASSQTQTTSQLHGFAHSKLTGTGDTIDGHTLSDLGWMACNEASSCVATVRFGQAYALYRFSVDAGNAISWQLISDDPSVVGSASRTGAVRGDSIAVLPPDGNVLVYMTLPSPGYYLIGTDNVFRTLLVSGQDVPGGKVGAVVTAKPAADGSVAFTFLMNSKIVSAQYKAGRLSVASATGLGEKIITIGAATPSNGFGYSQMLLSGVDTSAQKVPAAIDFTTGKVTDLATTPVRIDGVTYGIGQDNRPSDPAEYGMSYHGISPTLNGAVFVAPKPSVIFQDLNSYGADLIFCAVPTGCRRVVDSYATDSQTSPITPSTDIRCNSIGGCAYSTRSTGNPGAGFNQDLFLVKLAADGSVVSQAVALWNDNLFDGDQRDLMISIYGHMLADGRIIFWRSGQHGSYLVVATPPPQTYALVDSQSYTPAPFAPGVVVSVFGTNLSMATMGCGGTASTLLGGTQVLVNGQPAPIQFVSPGQINVQWPGDLVGDSATVQVVGPAGPGNTVSIALTAKE